MSQMNTLAHLTINSGNIANFSLSRQDSMLASLFAEVPDIDRNVTNGALLEMEQLDHRVRLCLHQWGPHDNLEIWSLDLVCPMTAMRGMFGKRALAIHDAWVGQGGSELKSNWKRFGLTPIVHNTLFMGHDEAFWESYQESMIGSYEAMGIAPPGIPRVSLPALISFLMPPLPTRHMSELLLNAAQIERMVSVVIVDRFMKRLAERN